MASNLEQLGLEPGTRAVILHVDDVGLCHAQNLGFFEVVEAGIVTSASLLVPCSWFPEAAEYARDRSELDLGVHLCLNSESAAYRWRPLAGAERVPSLVDRDGYFWSSTNETLKSARPEEVKLELQLQIEHAFRAGIDVTHLDAHMGTPMMMQLLPTYFELGSEYRLPVFFPKPSLKFLEEVGLPEVLDDLTAALDAAGVSDTLLIDHAELRSLSFDPDEVADHFHRIIAEELQPGVTHFLIHPARADEELAAVTPDSWLQRDAERKVFSSQATRKWFDEADVRLIGYRELRDCLRS